MIFAAVRVRRWRLSSVRHENYNYYSLIIAKVCWRVGAWSALRGRDCGQPDRTVNCNRTHRAPAVTGFRSTLVFVKPESLDLTKIFYLPTMLSLFLSLISIEVYYNNSLRTLGLSNFGTGSRLIVRSVLQIKFIRSSRSFQIMPVTWKWKDRTRENWFKNDPPSLNPLENWNILKIFIFIWSLPTHLLIFPLPTNT